MQGNCNKFKAFENSFFLLLLINLKPLYEEKKNKRGEVREVKAKERRRKKGRDAREGMRGYLETFPPSLAAVPNGTTLLAPFISLGFVSLLIFCLFSLYFLLCVFFVLCNRVSL